MDLTQYTQGGPEAERIADLLRLIPNGAHTALDIGARDGHLSKLLAERYESVTALDLKKPAIFDPVFCAEVLEHIPSQLLEKTCSELSRVSRTYVLIGTPYAQDIRVGRTTCYTCGKKNPLGGM